MATNRFSAEQGRSAAAAVNVVTRGGTDTLSGSATFLLRDDALQGLPATYDRSTGEAPPFSRQQYSATLGGPIARGKAWWFAAAEYRNQDAVVQTGTRDVATRTIRQTLAAAPLDDFLGLARVDVRALRRGHARRALRGAGRGGHGREHARPLDRLGLAAPGEREPPPPGPRDLDARHRGDRRQHAARELQRLPQLDRSRVARPPAHLPEHPGRGQLPRAAGHHPEALAARRLGVLGEGRPHAARRRRVRRTRTGRSTSASSATGASSWCRTSPQFDLNRDGRVDDNDLLFAVTLRSGKPDQNLLLDDCSSNYFAAFVQDDWRVTPQLTLNVGLRYELDTNVKNISGYADTNPIVAPFYQGDRGRDLDNLGPRLGFAWTNKKGTFQLHGGLGLYYDRVTLEIISLERGLDGRALPIEVRAGNVFFLDPGTGSVPPFAPTFADPFTGFILPGRRGLGHQHHRQHAREPDRAAVQPRHALPGARRRRAAARPGAQPRHALHHRAADRRGLQSGRGRPRPRRQPGVERRHALRRAARDASRSAGAAGSSCACPTAWRAPATTRTTTRSRSAPGRSTPTTSSASTAPRRTSSATAWCCRARSCCRWSCGSRASGRSLRPCRWTS